MYIKCQLNRTFPVGLLSFTHCTNEIKSIHRTLSANARIYIHIQQVWGVSVYLLNMNSQPAKSLAVIDVDIAAAFFVVVTVDVFVVRRPSLLL